jgi:hypothetical protein
MSTLKKGQLVTTPLGDGKVDGYGSPRGTSQPDFAHIWVWLNDAHNGTTLRRFPVEDVELRGDEGMS